ncbi:transposase [Ralstonia sp. 1138]
MAVFRSLGNDGFRDTLKIRDSLVPISKPSHYVESIEVLTEPERRRRRAAQEKIAIVQETLAPGASVSAVARRHGVNPNQVFGWRKQYQEGSLAAVQAGETVVPASELAAAIKEIKELQRLLGKNGMDAALLHKSGRRAAC